MEDKIKSCLDNGFACKDMHDVAHEMSNALEKNRKLLGKICRKFNGESVPQEIKTKYINGVEGYKKAFITFMNNSNKFECVQSLLKRKPDHIQSIIDQMNERITFMEGL